jgi:FeS assembly SUF system regulator
MIKISRLADYAVVVLTTLAEQGGGLMSAAAIAQKTLLPEPTVSKVLKLLARDGIIESIRGANGGYKLARPAPDIHVAQIIQAVEGPVSLTACVDGSNEVCDYHAGCPVNGRWDDVNRAVQSALESVTLADMMDARFFPKRSKETEIHGCI